MLSLLWSIEVLTLYGQLARKGIIDVKFEFNIYLLASLDTVHCTLYWTRYIVNKVIIAPCFQCSTHADKRTRCHFVFCYPFPFTALFDLSNYTNHTSRHCISIVEAFYWLCFLDHTGTNSNKVDQLPNLWSMDLMSSAHQIFLFWDSNLYKLILGVHSPILLWISPKLWE